MSWKRSRSCTEVATPLAKQGRLESDARQSQLQKVWSRNAIRVTLLHQLDKSDDTLCMLAHISESSLEESLEFEKFVALKAAQNVDIIGSKLERSHFKSNRSRRVGQEKAKVNVCS